MIDTLLFNVELAYIAVALIAWIWAVSQMIWFFRKRTGWRFSTALWMLAKAGYFSFVGSVFWFDWFDERVHAIVVWSFFLFKSEAFIHWLFLDEDSSEKNAPLKDG